MKQCPKCYKTYDDSLGKCLNCDTSLAVATIPQEDELSLDGINRLFDKEFKAPFLPPEGFYDRWAPTDERLNVMTREILKWLKLDDAPLTARYAKGMNVPGLYAWQGERAGIFIDKKYRKDPFQTAAILAHECMHHYMKRHNLELSDVKKNELKTDLSTVCSGLGVLIINGMSYKSRWYMTVILLFFGWIYVNEQRKSFGYYKARDYCKFFNSYLKLKGLDGSGVIGFIHPQARSFLPREISKKKAAVKSDAIASQEKRHKKNLVIQIIATIGVVSLAVALYYGAAKEEERDRKQIAAEFQAMRKQIEELESKIEQAKVKLGKMGKEIEYYRAINDVDNSEKTAILYEVLATQAQDDYRRYQLAVKRYNDKVSEIKRKK